MVAVELDDADRAAMIALLEAYDCRACAPTVEGLLWRGRR
jgi:hypothetical protein